jgi:hypothetical protein
MAVADNLLPKVKANLILEHDEDDGLLINYITAAVTYAESYQHVAAGWYETHIMPPTTEQAVIMLSSHFYESRDGSTAGFFSDNIQASQQVWNTVNLLLRLDREWSV